MAASLKGNSTNRLHGLMAALGCLFCLGNVAAEQLNDPTRPAIDLVPGLAASDATPITAPQGLQSVIISTQHEAAIINGIEVEAGHKFGDAILTVVNETCVVLMGPQGRQVMHMFPTVTMTKNELACEKRPGMQPIHKVASKQVITSKARIRSKAKKRAVICAPDEIKNGSGK